MILQLQEGFKLMAFGMSGVFIVTGVVYLSMKLLYKLDQK